MRRRRSRSAPIAIAQVVQPALAVVWSYLLLSETLQGGQVAGIAIALSGLLAFIVMNQRGEQIAGPPNGQKPSVASEGFGTAVVP